MMRERELGAVERHHMTDVQIRSICYMVVTIHKIYYLMEITTYGSGHCLAT